MWSSRKKINLSAVFVKLLSDLKILTQLQLVGVGVDFFSHWKEEGIRKEGITLT